MGAILPATQGFGISVAEAAAALSRFALMDCRSLGHEVAEAIEAERTPRIQRDPLPSEAKRCIQLGDDP